MANLILGYPNLSPDSILSGGSWQTDLNNLKDRRTRILARSTDTALSSSQFNFDTGGLNPIQVISLKRHNLTTDAKIRISSYTDAGYTTINYDSGFVEVFGRAYESTDLQWEDSGYWLGLIPADKLALFTSIWFTVLPLQYNDRYWCIEIDDVANEDGYIELGYLFVSNKWTPKLNFNYGGELNNENRTDKRESLSGVTYYDVREQKRSFNFTLDNMEYNEGYQRAFDIGRELGIHKDIFVSVDYEDLGNRFRNTLVGKLTDTTPINYSRYARMTKQFSIREDA